MLDKLNLSNSSRSDKDSESEEGKSSMSDKAGDKSENESFQLKKDSKLSGGLNSSISSLSDH